MTEAQPLWTPSAEQIARANLTRFIAQVRAAGPQTSSITDFESLYDWSIRDLEQFWSDVWRFCGVIVDGDFNGTGDPVLVGRDRVAPPDPVLGPKWFVGTRLNFAENLLRYRDDRDALVFWNENGAQRRLTYSQLYDEVARVAAALRGLGITVGDRVTGFMPNVPETVIAMLAATSIGAIWSSSSPDFGVNGVLDRSGRFSRACCFARTAICTPVRTSIAWIACARSPSESPRSSGSSSFRICGRTPTRRRFAAPFCGTTLFYQPPLSARSNLSASRSITRCTSCTRRGPRGCRSAWYTARAERCFSI